MNLGNYPLDPCSQIGALLSSLAFIELGIFVRENDMVHPKLHPSLFRLPKRPIISCHAVKCFVPKKDTFLYFFPFVIEKDTWRWV